MKRFTACFASIMLLVSVTGCGHHHMDRAMSGGALGSAAGLVAGAIVGGSATTGLLIGAGIGALTGAILHPNQVNLGRPIWK